MTTNETTPEPMTSTVQRESIEEKLEYCCRMQESMLLFPDDAQALRNLIDSARRTVTNCAIDRDLLVDLAVIVNPEPKIKFEDEDDVEPFPVVPMVEKALEAAFADGVEWESNGMKVVLR